MTTTAAWQRTIDNLDPDAFGKLVADDVLATATPLLGPDGGADRDDLETLLGMAALAGFRRLLDTVRMEALMGGADEATADDPSGEALLATIDSVRLARDALLRPDGLAVAVELMDNVLAAWERAQQ